MVDTMAAGDAKPLTRDDRGVWSGEFRPLPADIYDAGYIIDGALRSMGWVTVPGRPAEAWEPRKVPHGEVHQLFYDSPTFKMPRSVWVYTPPGYERDAAATYPVLYLLHGSGGVEGSWVMVGAANIILDNLIADLAARPMIVVMPFGHAEPSPRAGVTPTFTARDNAGFTRELTEDIMPMVERRFRIQRKPDARAIAGFSMGGGQARTIGLSRSDLFRSVATFSATIAGTRGAFTPDAAEAMLGDVLADPFATNSTLKLLWMAVGDGETSMLAQHKVLTEVLRNHNIRHTFVTLPGGHTWHVWRRNLRDLLPLLFR
jgi:enterochelin esterase family protein